MEKPNVSKRSEDLLEAILEISSEKGYAKSRDIATALQITPATVTDGFKRLAAADLVHYEPYGGVTLTKMGNTIARRTRECHQVIRMLLIHAGVGEDIADRDACIMEHGLSPESYEQLKRVLLFLEECLKEEDTSRLFEKIVLKDRKKT